MGRPVGIFFPPAAGVRNFGDPGSFTRVEEGGVATHPCETRALRLKAEARPNTLIARLWRWHTRWCPGWKAYQRSLAAGGGGERT